MNSMRKVCQINWLFRKQLGTKVNMFHSLTVRMLREELQLLQEQGSYVGEVVRAMDKKKVLVKVRQITSGDAM